MITDDCGLVNGRRGLSSTSSSAGFRDPTVERSPSGLNCRPPLYKFDAPPRLSCLQRDRLTEQLS
jgi:hypothetical protein